MKKYLPLLLAFVALPAFAAVNLSLSGLVEVIICLLIVGGIVWLLLFLVDYVGLPAPFNKVAKVIIMVVAVLILINILLGFVGSPVFTMK